MYLLNENYILFFIAEFINSNQLIFTKIYLMKKYIENLSFLLL